ncbi:hypothetical protein ACFWBI_38125 [Streptomyces sp. NPDC059982]
MATGYVLDSGGDTSASKVPVYANRNASNPSPNLKWDAVIFE